MIAGLRVRGGLQPSAARMSATQPAGISPTAFARQHCARSARRNVAETVQAHLRETPPTAISFAAFSDGRCRVSAGFRGSLLGQGQCREAHRGPGASKSQPGGAHECRAILHPSSSAPAMPSACAIGVRMSGIAPSCASIEPSTYSTSECTMLCAVNHAHRPAAGGRPNSRQASISSRPLFINVAESTEILRPITQRGCAHASVGRDALRRRPLQVCRRNGPPDAVSSMRFTPGGASPTARCRAACTEKSRCARCRRESASRRPRAPLRMNNGPDMTSDFLVRQQDAVCRRALRRDCRRPARQRSDDCGHDRSSTFGMRSRFRSSPCSGRRAPRSRYSRRCATARPAARARLSCQRTTAKRGRYVAQRTCSRWAASFSYIAAARRVRKRA